MFRRSGLNSFERPDEPAVCMPWFASMLVRTPSRPPRYVVPPHIAGCRVVRATTDNLWKHPCGGTS